MSFPAQALETILNMIRGIEPFDLSKALQAVLAIAQYASELFSGADAEAASVPDHMTLEDACVALEAYKSGEVVAAGLGQKVLLQLVLKYAMKWLSDYLNGNPAAAE